MGHASRRYNWGEYNLRTPDLILRVFTIGVIQVVARFTRIAHTARAGVAISEEIPTSEANVKRPIVVIRVAVRTIMSILAVVAPSAVPCIVLIAIAALDVIIKVYAIILGAFSAMLKSTSVNVAEETIRVSAGETVGGCSGGKGGDGIGGIYGVRNSVGVDGDVVVDAIVS